MKAQRIEPKGIPTIEPITVTAPKVPFAGIETKGLSSIRWNLKIKNRAIGTNGKGPHGKGDDFIPAKVRKTAYKASGKLRWYECVLCNDRRRAYTKDFCSGQTHPKCGLCGGNLRRVKGVPGVSAPAKAKPAGPIYNSSHRKMTDRQRSFLEYLGADPHTFARWDRKKASQEIDRLKRNLLAPPLRDTAATAAAAPF